MPNPFLKRVAVDDMSPEMQSSYERSLAVRGDATFVEVAANAPELFSWYTEFYQRVFYGGRVAVTLKELLRFKLSTLHGCRHCNLGNRRDALAAGVDAAKLDAIDQPAELIFSAEERTVLELAEQMSLLEPNGFLTKESYDRLRQFFSDAEIFELGMTMGILTGMAKFLFTFDLVERETDCPFPARHT